MTKRNPLDITARSFVPGSKRELVVRDGNFSASQYVKWKITGENATGEQESTLVNLSHESSIDVARHILEALAPALLREVKKPKFSDTPVGTFLRNKGTGEIVKVVKWDESYGEWAKREDQLAAVRADGSQLVPFQEEGHKYSWEVVEATETAVFKVAE